MTFSIRDLQTSVKNDGVARTNKFTVEFTQPMSMWASQITQSDKLLETQKKLTLHAEDARLPGAILLASPNRRYGYGPIEQRPFSVAFTDLMVIFRGDGDGKVHRYMNTWQRMAVNYDLRAGIRGMTGTARGQYAHEIGYRNDTNRKQGYVTRMFVTTYTDEGLPSIRIELVDAFPTAVAEVPLSWQANKDYMKVPVKFSFLDWHYTETQPMGLGSDSIRTGVPEIS